MSEDPIRMGKDRGVDSNALGSKAPFVGHSQNPIDRWSVYAAAGALAFSSVMMFAIMPIAVSAIQRRYEFKEGQLGDIIACYFAGVTAVSFTAFAWVRRFNWRTIATTGQVIAAASMFAALAAQDFSQLATVMVAAGVGGGITLALLLTLLGDSSNPDKAFAINLFIQATLATVMVFLLPMEFSNNVGDMRLLSIAMGGTVVVMSAGVLWLPRSGRKLASKGQLGSPPAERRHLWLPIVGTVATFLFATSYTAPWTFIAQAGVAKGLDPVFVGFSLAGAQFASIVGSIVAAVVSNRYGQLRPVCLGVAVFIIGIYFLEISHARETFAVGTFLFFLPSNFLLAYSLGLTAEVDAGGRLLGLSTASMLGPSWLVPGMAGRLYEKHGFASNLLMGLVSIVAGLMLFAWLLRAARHRRVESGLLAANS